MALTAVAYQLQTNKHPDNIISHVTRLHMHVYNHTSTALRFTINVSTLTVSQNLVTPRGTACWYSIATFFHGSPHLHRAVVSTTRVPIGDKSIPSQLLPKPFSAAASRSPKPPSAVSSPHRETPSPAFTSSPPIAAAFRASSRGPKIALGLPPPAFMSPLTTTFCASLWGLRIALALALPARGGAGAGSTPAYFRKVSIYSSAAAVGSLGSGRMTTDAALRSKVQTR